MKIVDSFTVSFLMEDLLLNLQVPQPPRLIVTCTNTSVLILRSGSQDLCTAVQVLTRWYPGSVLKDATRLWKLAHCDPQCQQRVHHYGNQRQWEKTGSSLLISPFFPCLLPFLPLSHLSRFQSFTEPSAAQEARLTSEWSRESPASGRKTTAPTLVLCPVSQSESQS